MHILINITSCGTLIGQALSKTAFAVTLMKFTKGRYHYVLWFCIGTMNLYMVLKVIFQWAKICNKSSYEVWYRLDFCLGPKFRDDFKEGGNGKWAAARTKETVSDSTSSLQHHHGFRVGYVSLDHHVEARYAKGREDWALRDHEPGRSCSNLSIPSR
jgi:hypothetical protein